MLCSHWTHLITFYRRPIIQNHYHAAENIAKCVEVSLSLCKWHATFWHGLNNLFFSKFHLFCLAQCIMLQAASSRWLNSNNWERQKIYCFQVVNGYSQEWCQEVSGHIIKWLRHVDLQQVPDVPAFVIHHLLHPTNSLITQRRRLIRGGSAANGPFKGLVCSGLSWFTRVRM